MSKYDKEREKLGLSKVGSASSVSTKSDSGKSKYALERAALSDPSLKRAAENQQYSNAMKSSRLMEIDNLKAQREKERTEQELIKANDVNWKSWAVPDASGDKLSLGLGPINQEKYNLQVDLMNRNGTIGPADPKSFALDDVVLAFQKNDDAAKKRLAESRFSELPQEVQTDWRNMALERSSELSRLNSDSRIATNLRQFADATKPIADIGMTLYTPGAGLGVLQGATRSAEALVAKTAPKLAGSALGRIGQVAASEALVGAPTAVGQTLTQNPEASGRELLESGALGAGGGALLGGLGKAIGEGVQAVSRYASERAILGVKSSLDVPEMNTPVNSQEARTAEQSVEAIQQPNASNKSIPTTKLGEYVSKFKNADEFEKEYKLPIVQKSERNPDFFEVGSDQMDVSGFIPKGETPYIYNIWYSNVPENGTDLSKIPKDILGKGTATRHVLSAIDEFAKRGHEQFKVYDMSDEAKGFMKNLEDKGYVSFVGYTKSASDDVGQATYKINKTIKDIFNDSKNETVFQSTPEREAQEAVKRVKEPRVRDRVYNYLDEAEKAARERISKRRNIGILPQGGNDVVDYAIIGAAKLGKGTIKFADWTEEMVKEFGEDFRKQAPKVYNEAKEVLRKQERIASKEGQEAIAFNESGIGDSSTFDAKINRKAPKKKESFGQKWERIRTQLVDDLAPLEGLEKRVRGRVASAEDSLYKSARMFKGVPEKAAQMVTQSLTPIIERIEKVGYSADDLGRYALAKHAKDVNASGYKSGFTNREIDDVLQRYGTPEMEAAQQALVKVNRDMLKELVDNGVVSRELAETLNERWQNYIPLFRSFDDEKVEFEGGLSKALANVASPIKSLQGSERAVIDPLENMIKNIYRSTNAAERNKVASKLINLANIDKDVQFIRKLDPMEEVGRKNVVNVKVNGENVKYEVEPEVYKALLNLDQESSNMIVNILSKPASLLRAGATLTPEFSLRNPFRDVIQAFVVSKSGFNPITDFGAGLIQAISKGKLYRDWIDNLGAYGNVMSMDRKVHRQALEKVLGESTSKKFINVVTGKSLIGLLRAISDTTESATKIGEYRAAIRKGASKEEAAYRSRDIMDFARAGTGIRQANKIVAFLNANIQGKSKLVRAIKENPAGTVTRAITAVTLPTVGFFMLNKEFANDVQRETIDNAPDWMRDSFWLVAVPGTDKVARIPKPFDLAAIFSNLPERALDYVYKNDKKAFDGFVSRSLSESSIPVQISGLLPIVEGMANYSFFRQGEIIPQRESNFAFGDQYDPVRTTETAKLLAKGMEKLTGGKGGFANFSSPRVMDNTIQGLTAGLGKYATDAIDSILMGKIPFTGKKVAPAIVDRPEAPSAKTEQKPLLRSFLVDPTQGGKVMDKFYNSLDKLSKEKSSNKLNGVTFGKTNFGKSDLYLPPDKDALLKSMNKSSDAVSDINKEIRNIEKDLKLTPKEKRQKIDVLISERMKLIKESVSQLK